MPLKTIKVYILFISGCVFFSCHNIKEAIGNSLIRTTSLPYYSYTNDTDLDVLVNDIGSRRIVLLGESSHGTAEFYTWRAALTNKLIKDKGFNLIAVEGDWTNIYKLNHYINDTDVDSSKLAEILKSNRRWPEWLWANREFASFVQWLKQYKQQYAPASTRFGVYGLDVFAFADALNALIPLLPDSISSNAARTAANCLKPYGVDALKYSSAVAGRKRGCAEEIKLLWNLVNTSSNQKLKTPDKFLQLLLASVVYDGERYFRSHNELTSWNTREHHMQETIARLLKYAGSNSKIIVWAHNTHVGDAHYTDMSTRERTNLGELLRKQWGEKNVYIVGSGFYKGTILSAKSWGAAAENIQVVPAKKGSWEEMIHSTNGVDEILLSSDLKSNKQVGTWIQQRSIGVANSVTYIPSVIPRRYDAFVYFETTHPLHPL